VYIKELVVYHIPILQGAAKLHGIFSEPLPMQREPPFDGCGLEQFLILACVPSPQVALHELQEPQMDQLPSNECNKFNLIVMGLD